MKNLFVLFLSIGLFTQTYAQKTAFISEAKILEATPGYAQAMDTMEQVKKNYTKEMKEAKQMLENKMNNLLKGYKIEPNTTQDQLQAMLSTNDKSQYALLMEENALLYKQIELKEKTYNALYDEKVGSILNKVDLIVKDYCKKNKIEILYKKEYLSNGLVYLEEKLDVTNSLIELVKKIENK